MYSDSAQDSMQSGADGMIRGTVRVVATNHNKAWVEAETQSACGGCAVAKGCGTKTISGYFSKRNAPIEIANNFDATVGDRVEVGIRNATILKVSAVIYLLPLVGLVIGAIAGEGLYAGDIVTMLSGVIGLAGGFYVARSVYVSKRFAAAVTPIFLKKLAPAYAGRPEQLLHTKAL